MPITVKHGAVGALGQLAVKAGQVRGQQLQLGRDIQFTSMALAAQDRAAQIGLASQQRDEDRAFAMQQAAAAQMARKRPAEPGTLNRQRELRKFVSEAKAAKIYDPRQIKQMGIFASLGDEQAVRSIAAKLPQETVRRQEIENQRKALGEIARGNIAEIQPQLDAITEQLEKRFGSQAQQFLRENPQFAGPEVRELLEQQGQLTEQITGITEQAMLTDRKLQLGMTLPEQMALEGRRQAQLVGMQEKEYKRGQQRAKAAGEITERDELQIDVMRDREQATRGDIGRQITQLQKDLGQFEDESDGDYAERIGPINTQIQTLRNDRIASFGSEKRQIEEFLGKRSRGVVTQTVTDASGQKWGFTGNYRDGKPLYEAVE